MTSYLISIIIWLCIILSLTAVYKDRIMENGWIAKEDIEKAKREGLVRNTLKCIMFSAIPIYRFLLAIVIIFMSNIKKSDVI